MMQHTASTLSRAFRMSSAAKWQLVATAAVSVVLFSLPITTVADTPLPEPALIKKRVTNALGGITLLQNFRSLRAVGAVETLDGFPGSYTLEAMAPDRRIVTWDVRYLQQTTAVDGAIGWEQVVVAPQLSNQRTLRELGGNELVRRQRDARFNVLFALIQTDAPFTVAAGQCPSDAPVYLMRFEGTDGNEETFGVDRDSYLPRCHIRTDAYEEGPTEIRTEYADYRRVNGLMLPFSIRTSRPENSLNITIGEYEVNSALASTVFENPEAEEFDEPIDLTLGTLPRRIYKEPDGRYETGPQRYWGIYYYPSESWSLDLIVKEKHGRYLKPERATAELYSGNRKIAAEEWTAEGLIGLRRAPIARFAPRNEIYGFRHNFTVASTHQIDKVLYTFEGKASDGRVYSASKEIPVTVYEPKTELIFPMKGNFFVTTGHEFFELGHKYERSQQFAIDVIALGENFEYARNRGASAEDYIGYARREIIAPADGQVVFASEGTPDGMSKAEYLKTEAGIHAIAGNLVIIDHGNGEFSSLGHMHKGSVRVKEGDWVRQGQVIGLLGSAGSPQLPHLHYQLQDASGIFGGDGLPLVFSNVERIGWLNGRRSGPVTQPRAGVFMKAR